MENYGLNTFTETKAFLSFPLIKALWRPTFNFVQLVIVLWRDFICVKIPQCNAYKSASCLYVRLRAKGGTACYFLQT
jgi:hypothetical protein